MKHIRKHYRKVAVLLLLTIVNSIVWPTGAYALTGGPSQPEVQSFQPIGVSDMVDLFSGDFQYNLPLMDVDGYPLNLSYSSQVSNDAEASWVGLGWNLNPGAINRAMRGLPDEFKGDLVLKENNMAPNVSFSASFNTSPEFFGVKKSKTVAKDGDTTIFKRGLDVSVGMTLEYNNYNGFSLAGEVSPSFSLSKVVGTEKISENGASLSLTSSSDGISGNLSFSALKNRGEKADITPSLGLGFNTRAGLQSLTIKTDIHSKFIKGEGTIPIGLQSYTPYNETPMLNYSGSFTFKTGAEYIGVFPNSSVSGTFSVQKLATKSMNIPAYGYLNTEQAGEDALLDINREKDGTFSANTPALPLTNYTYDLFSVSGQGAGGTFRPFRSDVGQVYDRRTENTTVGAGIGVDVGMGNAMKNGLNINVNHASSESGRWNDHYNKVGSDYFSSRNSGSTQDYETYAYRQLGETSVEEDDLVNGYYGGKDPIRVGLAPADIMHRTTSTMYKNTTTSGVPNEVGSTFTDQNYRTKRYKRNQHLTILTREEAERYGLENYLDITYNAPSYHPAEISLLKDDGMRYVYGIAAYNVSQEETSMNLGRKEKTRLQRAVLEADIDRSSGLVHYNTDDNSSDNSRGLDHSYNNTVLPPFAHSFLLTSVLSTDYVDIDGVRGPSKGDIGNYTKFSYEKVQEPYHWRSPYQQYSANFNEGLFSDLDDNQGNYTYGTKELWYLTKIETKNSVAIFTLEDRMDGYGVIDKNGGMGEVTTKLLRKITLYSKPDYDANGTSAIPIKTVNFEYDYSLCPNVPNNIGTTGGPDDNTDKGKLTLKKVYFTYGTSNRGKFSPYTFTYNTSNPDYGLQNYDRWGNYKPNNTSHRNSEFPYVDQNKTNADQYCQAWTLKEIVLPSGGKITVEYESDDYAYVQDKRAMQMFDIVSFKTAIPSSGAIVSDNYMMIGGVINQNFIMFKLQENLPSSTSVSDYKTSYLDGIENLYFKIFSDITGKGDYEYVTGYCELEDINTTGNAGLYSDGSSGTDYTHGFLKVKEVNIADNSASALVHPMAKASWQFGRLKMSRLLYSGVGDDNGNIRKYIAQIQDASFVKPLVQAIMGANGYLRDKGCGQTVQLSKSMVRLYSPIGKKLGGGSRVKKISISDQWQNMIPSGSTIDESVYGQEYTYTTTDAKTGKMISSGVACNEPSIGGDENPLRQPLYFGKKQQKLLAPDDRYYLEMPLGESFYPNSGVGYSNVTVKNISYGGVKRHATGHVINEFYTAKDFPVIVNNTKMDAKPTGIAPILKLFSKHTRNYMTVSQGYSVELNDMHGKPKAVWVYAEDSDKPISGTEYKYKCSAYQSSSNTPMAYRLDNTVQAVYPDGTAQQKELGVEYDVVSDFRQETTKTWSGAANLNMDGFLAGVIPLTVPMLVNNINSDKRGFRSAVITKVINRYGLVDQVIAHDLGSAVSTKNLAYDSETGSVILTQTKNEFEDDIYSFTYPAHWYYNNMGPAYKNYKMTFSSLSFNSSGETNISNAANWFVTGDEIISGTEIGWVTDVQSGAITVVNEIGKPFKPGATGQTITIIRSGRKNILKANIGSVVSMSDPLPALRTNAFSKIVNANVQVFKDEWKTFCECFDGESDFMKMSMNPYATGRKGIWRPFKAYLFLTNRDLTIKNTNTNIRTDGTYGTYTPFWKWDGDAWVIDDNNWTWTSEITEYSPFGVELENKDRLNRYSAATYGYNNSLPLSVASNAKYTDIGFDGFEDYDFTTCSNDHFSYRLNASAVGNSSSHTGKSSIGVSSSSNIKVSKNIQPCP